MIALQCCVSFYNTTMWISHACLVSHFSCVSLIATLWMVACQAPLSKALSRQEYRSGLPGPPPRDLPNRRTELRSLLCSALVGRFFTTSTTWETPGMHISLPSGAFLPCTSYPIPLGHQKVPSWAPCVIQLFPTSHLFYIWYCTYVSATLSISPTLSFPGCVHKFLHQANWPVFLIRIWIKHKERRNKMVTTNTP